jgi:hypothetical protein
MLRDNGASSLDPELRLLKEGCLTSFPSSSARFCRDPRGLGNGPFPALAGLFQLWSGSRLRRRMSASGWSCIHGSGAFRMFPNAIRRLGLEEAWTSSATRCSRKSRATSGGTASGGSA